MTSAELQRRIWQIANEVRGAVDGWDFKQYVLGALFYRFISENFANHIEGGDDGINYTELPDSVAPPRSKTTPSRPRAASSTPASCLPRSSPAPTATKA
jgi:type I restriction-modification system DNA methylase subunit